MVRTTRAVRLGLAALMALSTRAALFGLIAFIARIMRAARFGFRPCRMRATRRGRAVRIARSLRIPLSLGLRLLNIVALLMVEGQNELPSIDSCRVTQMVALTLEL